MLSAAAQMASSAANPRGRRPDSGARAGIASGSCEIVGIWRLLQNRLDNQPFGTAVVQAYLKER
jgi:hypothetical protein